MKTEITITTKETPLQRLRNKLNECGIEDPCTRMKILDLVGDLIWENWSEGFDKASEIHRGMLNQYINTQTP